MKYNLSKIFLTVTSWQRCEDSTSGHASNGAGGILRQCLDHFWIFVRQPLGQVHIILAGMIWSTTMFRVASNEHLLSQKKVSKDELPKVRISSMSSFSSKSSPGSLEPAGS